MLATRSGGDRAGRGAALLRAVAAAVLGTEHGLRMRRATCPECGRAHGAPSATAGGRTAWLSLAHAGGTSVAVGSTAGPVGVDAVPAEVDPTGLARMLPGVAPQELLRHWTRVEAVLKADGRGLRVDPGRIRFAADRRSAELDGVDYLLEEPALDGLVVTVARAARAAAG